MGTLCIFKQAYSVCVLSVPSVAPPMDYSLSLLSTMLSVELFGNPFKDPLRHGKAKPYGISHIGKMLYAKSHILWEKTQIIWENTEKTEKK